LLDYRYNAYKLGVKRQVVDMAINGSGIRDTSRVLSISKNTVISTLKKVHNTDTGQPDGDTPPESSNREVRLEAFCEAEMDEQWSYVGKKSKNVFKISSKIEVTH
jgi:hypothetical protein